MGKQTHTTSGVCILLLLATVMLPGCATAEPADARSIQYREYSRSELETMVGPVALYVDDLVAIVLTASTNPLQIVQAERFLIAHESDDTLEPDPDWDESVIALLNYPDVLRMMSAQLDWTENLGNAVAMQQEDVFVAIQDFRRRVRAAGNLASDDHVIVDTTGDDIEIRPVRREIVYVPYYEPSRVVVYSRAPVIHYYPIGYPLYYYPYEVGYRFSSGVFFGVSTAYVLGWHTHDVHVYYYNQVRHPYYGRRYVDRYFASDTRRRARHSYTYDRSRDHTWRAPSRPTSFANTQRVQRITRTDISRERNIERHRSVPDRQAYSYQREKETPNRTRAYGFSRGERHEGKRNVAPTREAPPRSARARIETEESEPEQQTRSGAKVHFEPQRRDRDKRTFRSVESQRRHKP